MITRRLSFGLLFLLGTTAAALGWAGNWFGLKIGYLMIAGHGLQVIGIFGAMLVPDEEIEETEQERHDPFQTIE